MVSGSIITKTSEVNERDLASIEWKNGVPRNLYTYIQKKSNEFNDSLLNGQETVHQLERVQE